VQGAVRVGAYWPFGHTRMHSEVALAVEVRVVRPSTHCVRSGVVCGPPGHVYPTSHTVHSEEGVAA
jgi:hypothetical protein